MGYYQGWYVVRSPSQPLLINIDSMKVKMRVGDTCRFARDVDGSVKDVLDLKWNISNLNVCDIISVEPQNGVCIFKAIGIGNCKIIAKLRDSVKSVYVTVE